MVKGKCQKERIAYIERLPDCLLLHILSFLCTYHAIQTSILSKRWKNLWKVLILHKAKHLDKFLLCWDNYDMHSQGIIDTWMRHIIELRPRDLEVEAYGVDLVWFPSYLLSCVTMERLCLFIKISERFEICSKLVNLPFLKSLSLLQVVIHEGFMNGFISACPRLDELTLLDCSLEISEIVLRDLTISSSYTKLLRIRTPNLVHLHCDAPPELISFESMPCLDNATIQLLEDDLGGEYNENVVIGLHNLANARSLKLYGDHIKKILEVESRNCCTFRNLESLVLCWFSISRKMQPIASFLRLTPNLVNLAFHHITIVASTEEEAGPEIQCCHLKAIEIGEECHELAKVVRKNLGKVAESIITIRLRPRVVIN